MCSLAKKALRYESTRLVCSALIGSGTLKFRTESMESGRLSMIVFGCEASRQRLADDSLGASPPSLSIFTLGSLAAFSFPLSALSSALFCACAMRVRGSLAISLPREEGALGSSQLCSALFVALLRVWLASFSLEEGLDTISSHLSFSFYH